MQIATCNNLKHRQLHRHSSYIATTLYDVIEAVSAQVAADEQNLLAPAVMKLLRDCGAGNLFKSSIPIYKKPYGVSNNTAFAG